jgi:hypothetical protein
MSEAAPSQRVATSVPPDDEPSGLRARWAAAWSARGFRVQLVLTLAAAVAGLSAFSHFLAWVEQRPGAQLADPVLARYPARDVAAVTFAVIYGAILVALVVQLRRPWQLVGTLQSYLLLVGMRALLMWVTPLDAPEHLIVLRDPIVNAAVPGPALQRDLFFSGHTSTLTLLALWMPGARLRAALAVGAALCAVLLLVQHAHYTTDVLVAPLAAWAAYSIVLRANRSARTTRL